MDTVFTLRIYGDTADVDTHFEQVSSLLSEIESALSRTDAESDVSRINRERSAEELSAHTVAVLQVAEKVMEATNGAYLPTMGAITELWQNAGETNTLPDESELAIALTAARQGFTIENGACTIHGEGALLDLGGIGKGYAADCVLAYLRESEVSGALLSFGSSVATLGDKGDGNPFTVSLRHPRNNADIVGILTAPSGVLSVSGDYERYVTVDGTNYHHVLDPSDGYPSDSGLASVAVLCDSGAWSDALSTAFLVMGQDAAGVLLSENLFDAEVIFVTPEGETLATAGIDFAVE